MDDHQIAEALDTVRWFAKRGLELRTFKGKLIAVFALDGAALDRLTYIERGVLWDDFEKLVEFLEIERAEIQQASFYERDYKARRGSDTAAAPEKKPLPAHQKHNGERRDGDGADGILPFGPSKQKEKP